MDLTKTTNFEDEKAKARQNFKEFCRKRVAEISATDDTVYNKAKIKSLLHQEFVQAELDAASPEEILMYARVYLIGRIPFSPCM